MPNKLKNCLIIIDNDPSVIKRLLFLFSHNYQCYTAMTGSAGLALCRQLSVYKPFVICDVILPDVSGLDVCKTIKNESPNTFVIFLTAYNDHDSRISGLLAKADNYIDKMVCDDELKLLVGNAFQTLHYDYIKDDKGAHVDDSQDKTLCALEVDVRLIVEAYYSEPPSSRKTKQCSSKYIAECLGKSQRTFQRAIKTETGYSFNQLQLLVRLEKAQGLLKKGYNVNQVADLLSFSSPSHLSRSFKNEFGVTPSKFSSIA